MVKCLSPLELNVTLKLLLQQGRIEDGYKELLHLQRRVLLRTKCVIERKLDIEGNFIFF